MPFNPAIEKCLGREWIKPTDGFFEQDFVKKYMADNKYTKETLPRIVLQESHGDHVVSLPEGGTLLGYSDTCNVEVYCIKNRVFCFQSHPDYNCGLQQDIGEPEYFLHGDISEEYHHYAYAKCSDTSMGPETRNMFFGIIREFIKA